MPDGLEPETARQPHQAAVEGKMELASLVDGKTSSRELVRNLRAIPTGPGILPESVAWQTYVELRRRGEPDASKLFVSAVRALHARRCVAGVDLPLEDPLTDEHRLIDDPFLADLWKAYKKCIRNRRTGPAGQLLRDMEQHLF